MKNKHYIIGAIVVVLAGLGWFFFGELGEKKEGFSGTGSRVEVAHDLPKEYAPKTLPVRYCPEASSLVKKGTTWIAEGGKWKNYTPSSAGRVVSFQGSQWVGVKIGKIICLYKTDEAAPFPLALEQTSVQSVLDPRKGGWSALVGNRKFCKSASVVDCPYFIEAPKDVTNIYEEIKYAPTID